MSYTLPEVVRIVQTYHELESAAKDFLFISSAALKNKDSKIKSAQKTLTALESYKKLPLEVRKELEKDKHSHVSNIEALEKLCRSSL